MPLTKAVSIANSIHRLRVDQVPIMNLSKVFTNLLEYWQQVGIFRYSFSLIKPQTSQGTRSSA